jgi:hypothetical protein
MWVLIVIVGVSIVGIAWFAVTLVTTKLNATPTMAIFDIEEATEYIAQNLPLRVASHLSHDDVRVLLRWEITYFRERGVASFGGVDHAAQQAVRKADSVVADEDAIVDELLSRAREEGMECDAVDIVCVADLTSDYLVAIGAVGGAVDVAGALEAQGLDALESADADKEIE